MKSSTRKEIINIIEKANYLFEEAEAKCESSDNIGFSAIELINEQRRNIDKLLFLFKHLENCPCCNDPWTNDVHSVCCNGIKHLKDCPCTAQKKSLNKLETLMQR